MEPVAPAGQNRQDDWQQQGHFQVQPLGTPLMHRVYSCLTYWDR
jgi:hypothetical protein